MHGQRGHKPGFQQARAEDHRKPLNSSRGISMCRERVTIAGAPGAQVLFRVPQPCPLFGSPLVQCTGCGSTLDPSTPGPHSMGVARGSTYPSTYPSTPLDPSTPRLPLEPPRRHERVSSPSIPSTSPSTSTPRQTLDDPSMYPSNPRRPGLSVWKAAGR